MSTNQSNSNSGEIKETRALCLEMVRLLKAHTDPPAVLNDKDKLLGVPLGIKMTAEKLHTALRDLVWIIEQKGDL